MDMAEIADARRQREPGLTNPDAQPGEENVVSPAATKPKAKHNCVPPVTPY